MRFILPLLFLCSCASNEQFIAAERATYEFIGPEYLGFVEASSMSEDDKEDRRLLVESWRRMLEEAE